jgi:hypothetical protein
LKQLAHRYALSRPQRYSYFFTDLSRRLSGDCSVSSIAAISDVKAADEMQRANRWFQRRPEYREGLQKLATRERIKTINVQMRAEPQSTRHRSKQVMRETMTVEDIR